MATVRSALGLINVPTRLVWRTAAGALAALLVGVIAHSALAFVPTDLSNFQNEYVCDTRTLIARPATVKDVQDAVRLHDHVKANGAGHSWNKPFFCANPDASSTKQAVVAQSGSGKSQSSSVNIMMTALRPLKIKVLEDEEAVLVDAGVITIDLLNYLSSYVTAKAPAGWTLPAFPWYVYQTVGGAVSTGTHGSSLKWGTMSNQVLEVQMVVANGSLITLTPASHPFLMRAARVSVGKLGIITQLKMRIVREEPVTRRLRLMPASAFVTLMREVQTSAEQGSHPGWLNETEFFWLPQRSEFMMVSFTRGDAPDLATRQAVLASYVPQNTTVYQTSQQLLQDKSLQRVQDLPLKPVSFSAPGGLTKDAWEDTEFVLQQQVNAPFTLPRTSSGSSVEPGRQALYRMFGRFGQSGDEPLNPVASGMSWKPPAPKMANVMYGLPASAPGLLEVSRVGVMSIAYNATVEATAAYLKEPEIYELTIKTVLFDQYEVAFPLRKAADCLAGVLDLAYGGDIDSSKPSTRASDKGFRTAPLIRVIGKEDALLGLTYDEPHMYINLEDYVYYNTGRRINAQFKAIMAYLRSNPNCGSSGLSGAGGRLHWGKAGWPDKGCWHGDKEFGINWCHFGCALRQLDPSSKFKDNAADRWNWKGVDLDRCCGPDGFDGSKSGCTCSVQHDRTAASCPAAPYYTDR